VAATSSKSGDIISVIYPEPAPTEGGDKIEEKEEKRERTERREKH
jgi:hypothetical protein